MRLCLEEYASSTQMMLKFSSTDFKNIWFGFVGFKCHLGNVISLNKRSDMLGTRYHKMVLEADAEK